MTSETNLVTRVKLTNLILPLAGMLTATSAFAVSPVMTLTSLDGKQTEGQVVAWSGDTLVVERSGATVELPLGQLLAVHPANAVEKSAELERFAELTDGSRLPLTEVTVTDQVASLSTPLSPSELVISTELIRLVQLTPRTKENEAFWQELVAKELPEDLLVIRKGESFQLDYLSGVLGDVSKEQVKFNWEGEDFPVKRSKITAFVYYQGTIPNLPPPSCWLSTRLGARLPVQTMELDQQAQTLRVTTIAGMEFEIPVGDLREADYSIGKLVYLSDLEPITQEWTPRIGLPASVELIRPYGLPRRDQSFTGSSLSLRWPAKSGSTADNAEIYAKGLAIRSRTLLEFRIPAEMNRFAAFAGIAPTTSGEGNVLLEISADGTMLWQGEIDGGETPVEINIKLPKARRLSLLVDYGENLDYGDRLHLVEARMTK